MYVMGGAVQGMNGCLGAWGCAGVCGCGGAVRCGMEKGRFARPFSLVMGQRGQSSISLRVTVPSSKVRVTK